MRKIVLKRSKKAGLPPGSIVFIGEQKLDVSKFSGIEYTQESIKEVSNENFQDFFEEFSLEKKESVHWIDITGLHNITNIEEIGKKFDLHPLTLEDIVNTDQRPKLEEFQHYLYLVLKMIIYDKNSQEIGIEQVSLILGENYLLSFQEKEGDVFDKIRTRIRSKKGKTIRYGPDYLAYSILDMIVDNYFEVIEKIGDAIEDLEEEILVNPNPSTIQQIYNFKREMILLRKTIWPLREIIGQLIREEFSLVGEKIDIYLRDVYDHSIQVIDTIETFRDLLSGMLDMHMTAMSNRMNEVMKVLTIIATIFIPLTFITGLYGMNFDRTISIFNMPELGWEFGYIFVWLIMITITIGMIFFFNRRKWL